MSSALERARKLLEANAAAAAQPAAAAAPAAPPVPAAPARTLTPAAAAPAGFESVKLKTSLEALEKRCDEMTATLETAIADIEAGALDQRLRGWLEAIVRRRGSGAVAVAVAGMKVRERFAATCDIDASALESEAVALAGDDGDRSFARAGIRAYAPHSPLPPRMSLAVVVQPERALGDAATLGFVRRASAGLLWLAPANALPAVLSDAFGDSAFGIVPMMPTEADLVPHLRRALPDAATPILAALVTARDLLDLVAAVQAEHARENERLGLQALVAERSKSARSLSAEVALRKDLLAQMRDDVARDLQSNVDELTRAIAQLDADMLLRLPMRQALDAIPALRAQEHLVYTHEFEIEERHQWWHGTRWERMQFMFPRKLRLTIPSAALRELSQNLTALLATLISKNATRRIDAFNRSIGDFSEITRSAGVDLEPAAILPAERIRFERKVDPRAYRSMQTSVSGPAATLEERIARAIDMACEKDLKNLHVDIDRKGPIGKIMEARTAVMGVSFMIMTGIRVSGAWNNLIGWLTTHGNTSTEPAHGGIPWNLILNASLVGFFIILLGMIVTAITEEGKEGAVVSEKVADARDALEDKLLQTMERVVDSELGEVKTLLGARRGVALERLDHAVDAKKLELEEVDRRARAAPARPAGRPGLTPLPTSMRGDVDKITLAVREMKTEFAARLAVHRELAAGAATAAKAAAEAPVAAPVAAAATEEPAAKPVNPALEALAARAAKRAAPAQAAARPANPALAALAERAAKRAAERAAAASNGAAEATPPEGAG